MFMTLICSNHQIKQKVFRNYCTVSLMAIPTALQRAVLHFFELTKYRCVPCRQISKSTSPAAPFFHWLTETPAAAGGGGGRILHPSCVFGVIISLLCHFS